LVLLGALAVLGYAVATDDGVDGIGAVPTAEGTRCEFRVTADVLNVRSGPDLRYPVVDRLRQDAVVEAEAVTERGFRRLGEGRWAAQDYLEPVSGDACG